MRKRGNEPDRYVNQEIPKNLEGTPLKVGIQCRRN